MNERHRRAMIQNMAALRPHLEAARGVVVAARPHAQSDKVTFAWAGEKTERTMNDAERRRLLGMTLFGRETALNSTKLAAFSQAAETTQQEERSSNLTREERDRILSLSAVGRGILLDRKKKERRGAGIPGGW